MSDRTARHDAALAEIAIAIAEMRAWAETSGDPVLAGQMRTWADVFARGLDPVAIGKRLGAAGGRARAAALTKDERKHGAHKAATARWKKAKP